MSILKVINREENNTREYALDICGNVRNMNEYLRHLGKRVRRAREDYGYSQQGLADVLARYGVAVKQATINHIENGNRKPSVEVLLALALALQVSTDYLLGLSDDSVLPEGRIASDAQLKLEVLFGQLSLQRQHELIVIAEALAEDDELPPMNDVERAVMAAIQFVEEVDGEKYRQLMDLLDSTSPALGRHMTFRRKHVADE